MQYEYETMTDEEMNGLLLELSGMRHYQAMLRYLKGRDTKITNALRTIDPFKNPTELAKSQGRFEGIWDITGAIKILQDDAAESEKARKDEDGQA